MTFCPWLSRRAKLACHASLARSTVDKVSLLIKNRDEMSDDPTLTGNLQGQTQGEHKGAPVNPEGMSVQEFLASLDPGQEIEIHRTFPINERGYLTAVPVDEIEDMHELIRVTYGPGKYTLKAKANTKSGSYKWSKGSAKIAIAGTPWSMQPAPRVAPVIAPSAPMGGASLDLQSRLLDMIESRVKAPPEQLKELMGAVQEVMGQQTQAGPADPMEQMFKMMENYKRMKKLFSGAGDDDDDDDEGDDDGEDLSDKGLLGTIANAVMKNAMGAKAQPQAHDAPPGWVRGPNGEWIQTVPARGAYVPQNVRRTPSVEEVEFYRNREREFARREGIENAREADRLRTVQMHGQNQQTKTAEKRHSFDQPEWYSRYIDRKPSIRFDLQGNPIYPPVNPSTAREDFGAPRVEVRREVPLSFGPPELKSRAEVYKEGTEWRYTRSGEVVPASDYVEKQEVPLSVGERELSFHYGESCPESMSATTAQRILANEESPNFHARLESESSMGTVPSQKERIEGVEASGEKQTVTPEPLPTVCEACGGQGFVESVAGERVACGPCSGNGVIVQKSEPSFSGRTEPCPECKGKGVLDGPGFDRPGVTYTCETCDGRGRVLTDAAMDEDEDEEEGDDVMLSEATPEAIVEEIENMDEDEQEHLFALLGPKFGVDSETIVELIRQQKAVMKGGQG